MELTVRVALGRVHLPDIVCCTTLFYFIFKSSSDPHPSTPPPYVVLFFLFLLRFLLLLLFALASSSDCPVGNFGFVAVCKARMVTRGRVFLWPCAKPAW